MRTVTRKLLGVTIATAVAILGGSATAVADTPTAPS
ncbi:MAG: hypothetical protein QOI71_548, partial [Gaiellales bacterium]|nr:hypothetical protein [Gaiellales bacterium]